MYQPRHQPRHQPHAATLATRLAGRTGIVLLSVFLNFAGFTLIIPVLPFLVARHVAPADVAFWVALILAVHALCSFIAAPVLGALSDRHGRRPVLLLSLCGSAAGFAVFGIGGALWVLVLGRILEGLTAGSISALYAYVADTHAPHERGRRSACWAWPAASVSCWDRCWAVCWDSCRWPRRCTAPPAWRC